MELLLRDHMLDRQASVVAITKYMICMAHVLQGGGNVDVFRLTPALYNRYVNVIAQQDSIDVWEQVSCGDDNEDCNCSIHR